MEKLEMKKFVFGEGDIEITTYDERPKDWSMENDYIREIKEIGPQVYRGESWMGRIAFIVEDKFGRAVLLPYQEAKEIANSLSFLIESLASESNPGDTK